MFTFHEPTKAATQYKYLLTYHSFLKGELPLFQLPLLSISLSPPFPFSPDEES